MDSKNIIFVEWMKIKTALMKEYGTTKDEICYCITNPEINSLIAKINDEMTKSLERIESC